MEKAKNVRFYELLEIHIINTLKSKFSQRAVDPNLLQEMHAVVRDTIEGIFSKSSHKLSADSLRWLALQYFKAIKLNDTDEVRTLIVANEYKLAELPYDDIKLMRDLFLPTKMSPELDEEFKRRSLS